MCGYYHLQTHLAARIDKPGASLVDLRLPMSLQNNKMCATKGGRLHERRQQDRRRLTGQRGLPTTWNTASQRGARRRRQCRRHRQLSTPRGGQVAPATHGATLSLLIVPSHGWPYREPLLGCHASHQRSLRPPCARGERGARCTSLWVSKVRNRVLPDGPPVDMPPLHRGRCWWVEHGLRELRRMARPPAHARPLESVLVA
ncbi:uncharacterized protein B0I36DRAFT_153211 [Microdochium trichocladiopsis]|uniref:Uncharacterized protein n=1 Tax=Microdochium trichocladiopsis TaxID=1682393 RepID=A0A9P9BM93_9PEZI|nr:uncharacterized protein B0I36DRAFT_153211 [Microdochium trichocladiopsis]KAH7026053.1 hypothetical protein B0I36DRAFT_153211 [Microdochium trichocladiopsis]